MTMQVEVYDRLEKLENYLSGEPQIDEQSMELIESMGLTGQKKGLTRENGTATLCEIPLPFEQLAPQERNLEYVVNAYGRIGGVLMYYPLACYIMEGI